MLNGYCGIETSLNKLLESTIRFHPQVHSLGNKPHIYRNALHLTLVCTSNHFSIIIITQNCRKPFYTSKKHTNLTFNVLSQLPVITQL